jgi:hypothetical protein
MYDCEQCKIFVNKQHFTLNQIMLMKTSAEIKAAFIAAVKDRTIIPIGKLSEYPSGLVFDKTSVNHYLDKLKSLLNGGMSFEEVKSTLQIDRTVLLGLIKADVLHCRYQLSGMRILEDSFQVFTDQYVLCKEIAYIKAMSQNSLMTLCHALGVGLYQLPQTKYLKQSPVWIERCQLALLGIYNDQEEFAIAA